MGIIRPLAPEIVDAFLNRKLDNFDWIKECTDEDLNKRISNLDPCPLFHVPLFKHQKEMFLLGVYNSYFNFHASMGLGKTRVILELISYFKLAGQVKKALILVPNLVLIQSWLDECTKFTPHLKAIGVHGTKSARWELLDVNADIYVLNYTGLQVLLAELVQHTKKRRKRIIDIQLAKEFAAEFDLIGYDEITAVSSIDSKTYKICNILSSIIPFRYGLTGTPIGRHPEDLWSQFHVMDRGESLGKNFYFFRNVYFKPSGRPWGIEWVFNKKLTNTLHETIKNRSIRYKLEDISLIPTRFVYRVPFPLDTLAYFDVENKTFKDVAIHGKADQIRASFIKLCEIASGFVNFKNDEGEIQQLVFPENPKIDLLVEKLRELPNDCKFIVFHNFQFTGHRITEALIKAKINHRWVYGGTPNKDKVKNIQDFRTDPKVQGLVLNSTSGSMGLNLQIANYVFYVECPIDPKVREQSEARICRTGQEKPTFVIDIVVKDSKDEDILDFIKEGKNLLESLIENRGE